MLITKNFSLFKVIQFSGHHLPWLFLWMSAVVALHQYQDQRWMSIPFMVLVGWIYVVMEIVGDYSENPFQGMANDIPMLSLCRTIEIDLLQMLGEEDLPPAIEAKKGILM